jgi:hypothetical protein
VTEVSHSETSSELEDMRAWARDLFEQLKLNAAVLVILLEQAGGVAEFTPEELSAIDVNRANVRMYLDEERNVYVVEGLYDDAG